MAKRSYWSWFTARMMDPRAFVTLILLLLLFLIKHWTVPNSHSESGDFTPRLTYYISRTWDDSSLERGEIKLTLLPHNDAGVKMLVEAPFFNDPPNPGGHAGKTFPGLWDYEVVEAFFLNDENHYLEVELCPHGQHLVLLLKGYRKPYKDQLPLEFHATIDGDTWKGEAVIPAIYFPKKVTKFNAYAIHGSDNKRVYEALYPAPSGKYTEPDFHRLEYFQSIDFTSILPVNSEDRYTSSVWAD